MFSVDVRMMRDSSWLKDPLWCAKRAHAQRGTCLAYTSPQDSKPEVDFSKIKIRVSRSWMEEFGDKERTEHLKRMGKLRDRVEEDQLDWPLREGVCGDACQQRCGEGLQVRQREIEAKMGCKWSRQGERWEGRREEDIVQTETPEVGIC